MCVCLSVGNDDVAEDVVCLLTKDEDDPTDRWTLVSNAKPISVKNSDVVSFDLQKVVKGRYVIQQYAVDISAM